MRVQAVPVPSKRRLFPAAPRGIINFGKEWFRMDRRNLLNDTETLLGPYAVSVTGA